MSTEQNKTLIRKLVEEFWNRGYEGVFDEVFADDFVDRTPQPGGEGTKEGFRQQALALRGAFANLQTSVDDLIAEGDKVAWRWTFQGTHTGSLLGIPATNKPIAMAGMTIDRIAGGQIVERWSQVDNLGFLQQLGAIPVPESPAS